MRVLVTGVSGYVGSNIAVWIKENANIWVTGIYNNRIPKVNLDELIQCNLAENSAVKILSNMQYDVVIHAAGCFSEDSVKGYIDNNIKATETILNYACENGVKKLIYVSTTSVYGEARGEISENSNHINLSDYGMTKRICERMVEESPIKSKLILRLSSTLGGRDNDFLRPWLPKVAYRMLRNMDITYFNPNLRYNAVVYVKDAAQFIYQFVLNDNNGCHDYILASCVPMTILEILKLLKKELGSCSVLIEKEAFEADRCFALDIQKAINDGFQARSVDEVIKCFARDVLQQEKSSKVGGK